MSWGPARRAVNVNREAGDVRRDVEDALDHAAGGGSWRWSLRLSRWIDGLILLEEAGE